MDSSTNVRQFAKDIEHLVEIADLYDEIPLQEIGNELGMPIGMSVGENILPYIKKLKEAK